MGIKTIFNGCEAVLWFGIAVALLLRSRRELPPVRRLGRIAAAAFLAFGVSDVIEIRTGAWWKPWWLFVLKGACVMAFAWCGWKYRRWLSAQKPPSSG